MLKHVALIFSLVFLFACEDSSDDYQLSGDISASDNGTGLVTGIVNAPEGINFHQQIDTNLEFGTFSIKANGEWQYDVNVEHADIIALSGQQSVLEKITVTTTDTHGHYISVEILGHDDAPVFGQGNGVDRANLSIEQAQQVSGTLTITDLDEGQSGFIALDSVSGHSGVFSINAAGEWLYELNDYQGSNESFTVTSIDGSEHTVEITFSLGFQRIVESKSILIRYDELNLTDLLGSEGLRFLLDSYEDELETSKYYYNDDGTLAYIAQITDDGSEKLTSRYSYTYHNSALEQISEARVYFWEDRNIDEPNAVTHSQWDVLKSNVSSYQIIEYNDDGSVDSIDSRRVTYHDDGSIFELFLTNDIHDDLKIGQFEYGYEGRIERMYEYPWWRDYSVGYQENDKIEYEFFYDNHGRTSEIFWQADEFYGDSFHLLYVYYPEQQAIATFYVSAENYRLGKLGDYSHIDIKFYQDISQCAPFVNIYQAPDAQCIERKDAPVTDSFRQLDN